MRAALLVAVLSMCGCASETAIQNAGFEYGRRYAWVKEGATDLDRQRAMFMCASPGESQLRAAMMISTVPFVGLATLGATVPAMNDTIWGRVRCMEADGWVLVDVVSGAPQRIENDAWRGHHPVPR